MTRPRPSPARPFRREKHIGLGRRSSFRLNHSSNRTNHSSRSRTCSEFGRRNIDHSNDNSRINHSTPCRIIGRDSGSRRRRIFLSRWSFPQASGWRANRSPPHQISRQTKPTHLDPNQLPGSLRTIRGIQGNHIQLPHSLFSLVQPCPTSNRSMKPTRVKKSFIPSSIPAGPFSFGATRQGKSSVVRQIADDKKIELLSVQHSFSTPPTCAEYQPLKTDKQNGAHHPFFHTIPHPRAFWSLTNSTPLLPSFRPASISLRVTAESGNTRSLEDGKSLRQAIGRKTEPWSSGCPPH